MDENELNDQLKNEKNYLGTYAIDELRDIKVSFFPSFCIVNLDRRSSGGSHWIALAIYENQIFICDSLGGVRPSPDTPKQIINFLAPFLAHRKVIMTRKLQPDDSDTCGLFCVTFINEIAKYNSICEFLKLFTSDNIQNENIVKFLNKRV